MQIDNREEFRKYVITCYPMEACGVIKNNVFIPVENVAEHPVDTFRFSIQDSYKYMEVDAIIHSHTFKKFKIDPRTPSLEDMIGAENSLLPWGIVHCDGENISDILWFNTKTIPDLLNRIYISGVYDCFTLVRDYYRLNYNMDSSIFPRPAEWEEWNPMFMENSVREYGFVDKKDNASPQPGDILLISMGSNYINHMGVVVSDNKFLHHLHNRVSMLDDISKWSKFIKYVLIYPGKDNGQ